MVLEVRTVVILGWWDDRNEAWGSLFLELGVGYCFSFHRKLLQTRWLNPTQIYSLTVLEAGSQKSRCRQGQAPSEGSRGQSVPCLFQLLVSPTVPCGRISPICLYLHMAFSPMASSLLSLVRRSVIGFRDHPGWSHLKSLNLISKTPFQIRSHSQVLEDISFWEPPFNSLQLPGCEILPSDAWMHFSDCVLYIHKDLKKKQQILRNTFVFTMTHLAHI